MPYLETMNGDSQSRRIENLGNTSNGTTSSLTTENIQNITSVVEQNFVTLPGMIVMFSGIAIPTGWALCDGATYGSFTTPDLRDKFILSSGTTYKPGATGGSSSYTAKIGVANMPAHTHTYKDVAYMENPSKGSDNNKGNYFTKGSQRNRLGSSGTDNDNADWYRTRTTDSTGSGQAFTIPTLPPYYALAFIIKLPPNSTS